MLGSSIASDLRDSSREAELVRISRIERLIWWLGTFVDSLAPTHVSASLLDHRVRTAGSRAVFRNDRISSPAWLGRFGRSKARTTPPIPLTRWSAGNL